MAEPAKRPARSKAASRAKPKPDNTNPAEPEATAPAAPLELPADAPAILGTQNTVGGQLTDEQLDAAVTLAHDLHRPIRVPPDHHLETGLADYMMWIRMFADSGGSPPATGRPTGRIWA